MTQKFSLTSFFFLFASIVWSASWWTYGVFMKLVHAPDWSEYKLMKAISEMCIFLALMYVIVKVITLRRASYGWPLIIWKVFLTFIGFTLIGLLALRNQNAEGLDVIFVFALVLVSRIIIGRFSLKPRQIFIGLLSAWLLIICINEIIQCFIPFRHGSTLDILNSMIAVLCGLLISYT